MIFRWWSVRQKALNHWLRIITTSKHVTALLKKFVIDWVWTLDLHTDSVMPSYPHCCFSMSACWQLLQTLLCEQTYAFFFLNKMEYILIDYIRTIMDQNNENILYWLAAVDINPASHLIHSNAIWITQNGIIWTSVLPFCKPLLKLVTKQMSSNRFLNKNFAYWVTSIWKSQNLRYGGTIGPFPS